MTAFHNDLHKKFIYIFIQHALIIQKSQTYCSKRGISKQIHVAYGSVVWETSQSQVWDLKLWMVIGFNNK